MIACKQKCRLKLPCKEETIYKHVAETQLPSLGSSLLKRESGKLCCGQRHSACITTAWLHCNRVLACLQYRPVTHQKHYEMKNTTNETVNC